jgi:hypothetical protein
VSGASRQRQPSLLSVAGKRALRNSKNSDSHPVRVTSGLRDARGSRTWKSPVSYIDVETTISLEQSGKPARVWKRNQDGYSRVDEIRTAYMIVVHRQNCELYRLQRLIVKALDA